jgi:hypothetical protein
MAASTLRTRRVQKRRCSAPAPAPAPSLPPPRTPRPPPPSPSGPVRPASLDSRFFCATALPAALLLGLALLPYRGTRFYLGPFCSSPGACYQRPALQYPTCFTRLLTTSCPATLIAPGGASHLTPFITLTTPPPSTFTSLRPRLPPTRQPATSLPYAYIDIRVRLSALPSR